jgi:hypothetical protein
VILLLHGGDWSIVSPPPPPPLSPLQWVKVQALEAQAEDAMFVIVSDVHLDKPTVLEKLRNMFEGFSQVLSHSHNLKVLYSWLCWLEVDGWGWVVGG